MKSGESAEDWNIDREFAVYFVNDHVSTSG